MMTGKKIVIFSVGMLLASISLLICYMHVVSPAAVRWPTFEHAHIRLQVLVDGAHINFANAAFQQPYDTKCTDELSAQPIHFHDNKDQFVHLHWKGITGGLLLKNYGWNFIGGPDDILGYRFDKAPFMQRVPIHGSVLPDVPRETTLWAYTGHDTRYNLRDSHDFLFQDIETFLGAKNTYTARDKSILRDIVFARAAAHDAAAGSDLTRLHNMLGDIIVFVQKDKPSDAQVKERFSKFEPLPESSCGG